MSLQLLVAPFVGSARNFAHRTCDAASRVSSCKSTNPHTCRGLLAVLIGTVDIPEALDSPLYNSSQRATLRLLAVLCPVIYIQKGLSAEGVDAFKKMDIRQMVGQVLRLGESLSPSREPQLSCNISTTPWLSKIDSAYPPMRTWAPRPYHYVGAHDLEVPHAAHRKRVAGEGPARLTD